jgi:hypothetical protein
MVERITNAFPLSHSFLVLPDAMNSPEPNFNSIPEPYANFDELHDFLTQEMGLLPEPAHGGSWRTYFFKEIIWHPLRTTRTVKILLDHAKKPFKIQLCVSSDNNNSVFVSPPFEHDALKLAIENETSQLLHR